MNWIKVTPDTMPKDKEEVIVTVEHILKNGSVARYTVSGIRYTKREGWQFFSNPLYGQWNKYSENVTHWMPLPEPAQDDE